VIEGEKQLQRELLSTAIENQVGRTEGSLRDEVQCVRRDSRVVPPAEVQQEGHFWRHSDGSPRVAAAASASVGRDRRRSRVLELGRHVDCKVSHVFRHGDHLRAFALWMNTLLAQRLPERQNGHLQVREGLQDRLFIGR